MNRTGLIIYKNYKYICSIHIQNEVRFNIFIKRLLTSCILLLIAGNVFAQTIDGKVINALTGEPVPYASVQEKNTKRGTQTTINGTFSLFVSKKPTTVIFQCLGFQMQEAHVRKNENNLVVKLHPQNYLMDSAIVTAGENPAIAIMRHVIENKKEVRPKNNEAFSYKIFTRFVMRRKKNYIDKDVLVTMDSTTRDIHEFLNENYLFINEMVLQHYFKRPAKTKKIIIASKTSGLESPLLSTLIAPLQNFTFYDNILQVGNFEYRSPIADNALNKYNYYITDTAIAAGGDTILKIRYFPQNRQAALGLEGELQVNKKYFVLESIIAKPVFGQGRGAVIYHQYKKIKKTWFAVKQNINAKLPITIIPNLNLVAVGKSYLSNIKLNADANVGSFNAVALEVDPNATKKVDTRIGKLRKTLTPEKDSSTYHVIDSLSKTIKLERRLQGLQALREGQFRVRFIDIYLESILGYNNYEGIQLGIGLETNENMLDWFEIGGYFRYGFKDKAIKYGGHLSFFPYKKLDIDITLAYKQDLLIAGNTNLSVYSAANLLTNYKQFTLTRFDSLREFYGSFSIRPRKNITLLLHGKHQIVNPTNQYRFEPTAQSNPIFRFTEIGIGIRWAIGEKYKAFGWQYMAKPTNYPVIAFGYTQGLNSIGGEFLYSRFLFRIDETIHFAGKKQTYIGLHAGFVLNNVPYSKLFYGRGSYADFSIVTRQTTFETMRPNEFLSDKYIGLFVSHNFGRLFTLSQYIQPALSLVHNIGFGWLTDRSNHQSIKFKTMEKGFYEGGFILDNILAFNFVGFGVGVFYRYGPYSSPQIVQNFYLKLALQVGF